MYIVLFWLLFPEINLKISNFLYHCFRKIRQQLINIDTLKRNQKKYNIYEMDNLSYRSFQDKPFPEV